MFEIEQLKTIAGLWGKELQRVCPELDIAGSPDRVSFRTVFEAGDGALFILAQVASSVLTRKQQIAQVLFRLQEAEMRGVYSYLKSLSGDFIVEHEENFWQMAAYIPGERLARPDYIADAWRGEALALFLADLRAYSPQLRDIRNDDFSFGNYTRSVIEGVRHSHKYIANAITPVFNFLEDKFLDGVDTFPSAFCHGDYHPLNVVWGTAEIKGVIDWEFCGVKPEIYDAALLISCIGIEGPKAFKSPLIRQFLRVSREQGLYQKQSWDNLVECMAALRLAWLVEWIRKKNEEMLTFEIEYVKALVEYREIIRKTLLG